jgi:hypothetical protein
MNVRNRTDPRIALWLCSNNSGRIPDPSRGVVALGILGGRCPDHICARCGFVASTYRAGGGPLHKRRSYIPDIKRPTHAISVAVLRATTTRARSLWA